MGVFSWARYPSEFGHARPNALESSVLCPRSSLSVLYTPVLDMSLLRSGEWESAPPCEEAHSEMSVIMPAERNQVVSGPREFPKLIVIVGY